MHLIGISKAEPEVSITSNTQNENTSPCFADISNYANNFSSHNKWTKKVDACTKRLSVCVCSCERVCWVGVFGNNLNME